MHEIVMSGCFSSPFSPPNVAPFESLFPRNASSQRWTDDAEKRRTDGRDLEQEEGVSSFELRNLEETCLILTDGRIQDISLIKYRVLLKCCVSLKECFSYQGIFLVFILICVD